MLIAILIITKARAVVKLDTMEILFLITLDSQNAFAVEDHIILLDALYDHTQNDPLWAIMRNLITQGHFKSQMEVNHRSVIASIFIREYDKEKLLQLFYINSM